MFEIKRQRVEATRGGKNCECEKKTEKGKEKRGMAKQNKAVNRKEIEEEVWR